MNQVGAVQIEIDFPSGADATSVAKAMAVVKAFVDAINLGLFERGSATDAGPGPVPNSRSLIVSSVPEHAFAVLNGMLAYHANVVQPLDPWRIVGLPGPRDLAKTSALPPELPDPRPLPGEFRPGEVLTPPLVVTVELARPPDPVMVDKFTEELGIWHRLLQGGYPPPDSPPGESGTSPPTIKMTDPFTLMYSVEMWRTGFEAFVPLYNLVRAWIKKGVDVVAVNVTD
jgi:hypothetical protein